jgi:hypothetical protein
LSPFRQSATTAHFDTSRANYCSTLKADDERNKKRITALGLVVREFD